LSCKCQKCGAQYKIDFIIPDELWEKIKPEGKKKGAGLLCGPCIAQKLEEQGRYGMFLLQPESSETIDKMEEWERGFARNEKIRSSLINTKDNS
jgi:hypothetical protein